MQRRVQRLDAATRAQIQHAANGRAHGHRRQRERRPANAKDVVAVELPASHRLAAIRGDPPCAARVNVERPQVDQRLHGVVVAAPGHGNEARRRRPFHPQAGQCVGQLGTRYAIAQREQPGEDRERLVPCLPCCEPSGDKLLAVERAYGAIAYELRDGLNRPPDEVGAQGGHGVGRKGGRGDSASGTLAQATRP